jgi:hypothetical protein
MTQQLPQGVSRQGLDATFEADEAQKSSLILHAQLLRQQHQDEAAATQFAEAARLEERLSDWCEAQGLVEKAVVHRFSAASCWAQAGDFYHAIALCDDLLARTDLPSRLRQRIADYAQTLRDRRAHWYEELVLETADQEG